MGKVIRIGTRSSELALWQANIVSQSLIELGVETEIVKIDSQGDLNLDQPLYELGITGVFTRNLDVALLKGSIDIAVHSMKDVPTVLPDDIVQAAVLKRGGYNDILVYKGNEEFLGQKNAIIATGSLRRKAQWLHRYPTHTVIGLRGNVNTRLNKLENNDWDGAIFADAGLQRLKLVPENHVKLGWMVPSPAQGIVMVTALKSDEETVAICKELNHEETEICAHVERDFLNTLEGGCSAPIGAVAYIKEERIVFRGALFSLDGKQKISIANDYYASDFIDIGKGCARDILKRGGKKMMLEMIIEDKKKINILSTKELATPQTDLFKKDIGFKMSDFITIRYNRLKTNLINNTIENVVITSQNGVEALLQNFSQAELSFKNIYCVGRRTKRKIERQISKVAHVENTALELAEYLIEQKNLEEITFFCGNKKRDELTSMLTQNDIIVNEIEVYRTLLNKRKFEDKFDGVLFFSPTGIESYLVENKNVDTVAFCIGGTTAFEAKKHFKKVKVAKLPTIESVIKLVNQYYE